jgi:hypothetical protein
MSNANIPVVPVTGKKEQPKYAFPNGPTLGVGIWLFTFAVTIFILLYQEMGNEIISKWFHSSNTPDNVQHKIKESIIVLFAAGLGSWINTTRGYLKHASTDQDFESAYIPWYIARPFQGMLLGLVFYFAIRGGLLVLTLEAGNNVQVKDLNDLALAAIASMVGLLSKNAIDKLRDLFHTLFASKEDGDGGN